MSHAAIHRQRVIEIVQLWDGVDYLELITDIAEAARMYSLYSFLHFIVREHNKGCEEPVITEHGGIEMSSVPWKISSISPDLNSEETGDDSNQ